MTLDSFLICDRRHYTKGAPGLSSALRGEFERGGRAENARCASGVSADRYQEAAYNGLYSFGSWERGRCGCGGEAENTMAVAASETVDDVQAAMDAPDRLIEA